MSEDQETIAEYLTSQIEDYDEEERRADNTRLIRLNDAKEMLRAAARRIDQETPGVWQLMVGSGMKFTGDALLGFTQGVKKLVKRAGFFDAISRLLFGVDSALEPIARKFAAFFGQKVATSFGGPWQRLLDYFNPLKRVKGQYKAELVIHFMEALAAKQVAEMVDKACVRSQFVSRAEEYKQRKVLKQKLPARRVRKTIRSRNPGRERNASRA